MYKYHLKCVFSGLRITAGMDITYSKHIYIVFVINKFMSKFFSEKNIRGQEQGLYPSPSPAAQSAEQKWSGSAAI